MSSKLGFAILALAACGGSSSTTDGGKTVDTPTVPAMITISGTTSEVTASGKTPVAGATVTAFKASDDSMVGTPVMSDAQGAFSITFTTNGAALDGYLSAAKGTMYVPAFLYPPAPVSADFAAATVDLLTPSTFMLAATLAQVSGGQLDTDGFIGIEVYDATNTAVGGAVVTSTPAGTVRYDMNGLPNKTPTMTDVDGTAYIYNVAAGQVALSATKSGTTFKTHSVKARAGAVTETLLTP